MQMRAVFDHIAEQAFVVLLQAAYDATDACALARTSTGGRTMAHARCVVAEVNSAVVAPAGSPLIPESRFDRLVATQRPLQPFPAPSR
jgi:hypothetical protein